MPIATCTCGAKIRLPDGPIAVAMRCPRCKAPIDTSAVIAAPAAPAAMTATAPPPPMTATEPAPVSPPAPPPGIGTPATAEEIGKVCPVCQTAVAEGERVQNCAACGQLHHGACWEEVGGCATYGCANAHETVKPQESAQPTSAWGDTKKCPACGETIKAIALRCRYCNSDFPTIDPMTAADLRKRAWNADEAKSTRTATIVLFAFSLIGIFAPIMVIVCLVWMWPNRKKIEKAGPAFLVLGYAALGLSVIYSLMMLMFFALS